MEHVRITPAVTPALIAHGGAGGRGPAAERPERRRGMLAAVAAGAEVLRAGGSALDAVVATVRALEDHPLFNAGVGSLLTVEGTVEMDASVMVALPPPPMPRHGAASAAAGRSRRARAPRPSDRAGARNCAPARLPSSRACAIRSCSRAR